MKQFILAPALASVVMLGALPALAQEGPPEGTDWSALLIETIEDNDCVMTEDEAADELPGLGFSVEWTATVVYELLEAGQVEFRDGDGALVAKTEKCQ